MSSQSSNLYLRLHNVVCAGRVIVELFILHSYSLGINRPLAIRVVATISQTPCSEGGKGMGVSHREDQSQGNQTSLFRESIQKIQDKKKSHLKVANKHTDLDPTLYPDFGFQVVTLTRRETFMMFLLIMSCCCFLLSASKSNVCLFSKHVVFYIHGTTPTTTQKLLRKELQTLLNNSFLWHSNHHHFFLPQNN